MDEEIKKLLEENIVLSKENNNLLTKLYKLYKTRQIISILKIVIIIGIAFGAFYFIESSISGLFSNYGVDLSEFKKLFMME